MPPGPPPPGTAFWTITAANLFGGPDGIKLVGCHIVQHANDFTFNRPDWTVLKHSSGPPRPKVAFTFPEFDYNGIHHWTISMSAPPAMSNLPWGIDHWSFPPQLVGEDTGSGQSGEFTAQAGSGLGLGEEAASSAKA
jgi:hypothetical protein